MPSTRGASKMGKVDGGLPSYVALVRDTFEVKVEQRLSHGQAWLHGLALLSVACGAVH